MGDLGHWETTEGIRKGHPAASSPQAGGVITLPAMQIGTRLLRDYHPVDVTVGGDVLAVGARVFVTDVALLVYQADDQRQVVRTHAIPLATDNLPRADRSSLRGAALDLMTDEGNQVWVNTGRGCGCGSPLRIMERPLLW